MKAFFLTFRDTAQTASGLFFGGGDASATIVQTVSGQSLPAARLAAVSARPRRILARPHGSEASGSNWELVFRRRLTPDGYTHRIVGALASPSQPYDATS